MGLWECCYVAAVVEECFSLGVLKYCMLYVCVRDVMDVVFSVPIREAWMCRSSCMRSVSVLSCRCCMFVSCVHPVTCSLLMQVEDERGDHKEETYSRAVLMIAL